MMPARCGSAGGTLPHPRAGPPSGPLDQPSVQPQPPQLKSYSLLCQRCRLGARISHAKQSSLEPRPPGPGAVGLRWDTVPAAPTTLDPSSSLPLGSFGSGRSAHQACSAPDPSPTTLGEEALPLGVSQGRCLQPTPPGRGLGRRGPQSVPSCGQRAPHPPPGRGAARRRAARSHQEAVPARQRPLRAVDGLGALDLDVDRGRARFASGGGGAGRQGHVLGAAAVRARVLAARGAADRLRRGPQEPGDAAAAPAGLAPGRHGVLSVGNNRRRVSGLRRGAAWARPGSASRQPLGSRAARRAPPPLASRSASTSSPLRLVQGR